MSESTEAFVFMVFGLGFFIFCCVMANRDNREQWQRRIMEAREFGFDDRARHTVGTLRGRKK